MTYLRRYGLWKEFEKCKTLIIKEWETKATKYPIKRLGSAKIERKQYNKGLYLMEGVKGYDFFYVEKPIPITSLKISGKTTMIDDPLHQYGMEILAKKSKGNVLVGGLGLGLIIHELIKNSSVKRIDVVEINEDVFNLIKPFLPDKVNIIKGDIFDKKFLGKDYNTIILDLWVKGAKEMGEDIFSEMMGAFFHFKSNYLKSNVYIWGLRCSAINPAVEKPICKFYDYLKKNREGKLL